MWANINEHGDFNMPHVHEGVLSGVFYCKTPENSGRLILQDPAVRSNAHLIKNSDFLSIHVQGGERYKDCITIKEFDNMKKTSFIIFANPNSPTGTIIESKKIFKIIQKAKQNNCYVIIDEAYYEYLDPKKNKSAVSLIKKYKNLFVTRSFSKIYGLASLRIGYGISSENNIEKLKLYKQPFNTNLFAQKAAEIAIDDHHFVNESKKNNDIALASLIQLFDELSIRYLGTYCNFITFEAGKNSKALFDYLLKKGIVIRPLLNYKLSNYLRVSLGTRKEMNAFKKQLKSFYNCKV